MKKLLFILTTAVLVLTMSVMTACGTQGSEQKPEDEQKEPELTFEEQMALALTDIEAYAAKKLQEHDYTEENAAMLETFVAQGKEDVEACETQEALEEALNEALYNLDSVAYTEVFDEELMGRFYELEEAYELGLITKTDLERLAYYNNHYRDAVRYPLPLNGRVEIAIRETAAQEAREKLKHPEAEAEHFVVFTYCGVHSGCYAFLLESERYYRFPEMIGGYDTEIGGVMFTFSYNMGFRYGKLKLWKAND